MRAQTVAKAFGRVLRRVRIERALSQEMITERCELDRTYPSLLERGLRTPTLSVVIDLALGLRMAPDALVKAAWEELRSSLPSAAPPSAPEANYARIVSKR